MNSNQNKGIIYQRELKPLVEFDEAEIELGLIQVYDCAECDGTGEVQLTDEFGDWYPEYGTEVCPECLGSGKFGEG